MTICATLTDWTCDCGLPASAGKAVLVFSTAASAKFQELVAPYMAPSMEYKLLPRFRGQSKVVAAVRRTDAGAGAGANSRCARQDRTLDR